MSVRIMEIPEMIPLLEEGFATPDNVLIVDMEDHELYLLDEQTNMTFEESLLWIANGNAVALIKSE